MRKGWRTVCALLALPGLAAAQTAAPSETKDSTVKLDAYVVTGSYLSAAADEANALPVQIIDAKVIEQTGVTKSVLEVLRKAVPQIIGGNNIGAENANVNSGATNGGAQVSLRNTRTLVLIDGQRVAFDPVAGSGGFQFVDLNVVPVSAVERIEVLTDGASAIYGSDAVSGVINVILKKNYEGAEIGTYYGFTKSDKTGALYRDRMVSLVAGAANGRTAITVSAEWSKSDPLWEKDYNYTSPSYGSISYPGIINVADANGDSHYYQLNPSLNAPPSTPAAIADLVAAGVYIERAPDDLTTGFDLSSRPTFLAGLDKQIASIALEHTIGSTLTAKAGLLYSKTDSFSALNPQPIVAVINDPDDPASFIHPGIPITDENAVVRNRFLFAGNRNFPIETRSLRATAELDGRLGSDWTWTLAALFNTSDQDQTQENLILNSALQEGIRSGLINLAAIEQDPEKVAEADIFGTSLATFKSKLIGYDARATGRFLELPAGSAATAFGVGYRKEQLSAAADKTSVRNPATGESAWNNGVTIDPFDQERTTKSAFIEVKVPLTSPALHVPGLYTTSLDGAVRYETFSTGGSTTVPKLSLRWLPFDDQFAIRSTFSKSFAVPTLFQLYGPTSSGATAPFDGLIAYDANGNPIGDFPNLQGQVQSGSNPDLKPTSSKNYSVGFVFSPKALKGLSLTVDYYHIVETDIPGTLAPTSIIVQDVERYGPASSFAPYVHLGNYGQLGGKPVTAPGQLHGNPTSIYVDQFVGNVASRTQDGVDLNLAYAFVTTCGTFDLSTAWVYQHSFRQERFPGDTLTEFVGNDGAGTLPRFREFTTFGWSNGPWAAQVSNTYIHSITAFGHPDVSIPSHTTFDLQGSADIGKLWPKLKGLSVTAGINNVFDRYPPVDPYNFSDPPADTGTYGSFGRFYYVSMKYKF